MVLDTGEMVHTENYRSMTICWLPVLLATLMEPVKLALTIWHHLCQDTSHTDTLDTEIRNHTTIDSSSGYKPEDELIEPPGDISGEGRSTAKSKIMFGE